MVSRGHREQRYLLQAINRLQLARLEIVGPLSLFEASFARLLHVSDDDGRHGSLPDPSSRLARRLERFHVDFHGLEHHKRLVLALVLGRGRYCIVPHLSSSLAAAVVGAEIDLGRAILHLRGGGRHHGPLKVEVELRLLHLVRSTVRTEAFPLRRVELA